MQQPEERLLFIDKFSHAAKPEMLRIFISYFDEVIKQDFKDFILFVEVLPTASETAIAALVEILKDHNVDINKFVHFSSCYLIHVVQRRIKNYASHPIYMNCHYHRLNLLVSAK